MRQSVRVKATLESPENSQGDARIADLCPEDRDKVAKLVRRIVEVGTLQEEGEKEFQRQRDVFETEVQELRAQIKRDAEEIEEMSGKLRLAKRKAKMFQERVLVLEESTETEMRSRLDAEQTLDLLKLELDKLRTLVRRQQDEMQSKTTEQQERFDAELQHLNLELKEVQELLLQERQDRVLEMQKALDKRLERSAAVKEEKPILGGTPPAETMALDKTSYPPKSDAPRHGLLDMSSFLNTSVELPDKMKEVMEDWKQRMEEALAAVKVPENRTTEAVSTTDQTRDSTATVSTACQTDIEEVLPKRTVPVDAVSNKKMIDDAEPRKPEDGFVTPVASQSPIIRPDSMEKRLDFDQYISEPSLDIGGDVSKTSFEKNDEVVEASKDDPWNKKLTQGIGDPIAQEHLMEAESDTMRQTKESALKHHDAIANASPDSKRNESDPLATPCATPQSENEQQNRQQNERNQPASRSVDSDGDGNGRNFSDLPDFSFLNVMNGPHPRQSHQGLDEQTTSHVSYNGMYETSLFDVVDAIEKTQQVTRPYQQLPNQSQSYPVTVCSSPSARVENLRQHVEARERLLFQKYDAAHLRDQVARPQDSWHAASSAIGDLAAFEEVKDLYAEDLSQRWGALISNVQTATSPNQTGIRGEPRNDYSIPGQPPSPLELSVQMSIERDIQDLLHSENLPPREY
ncbi:hypothetical protein PHYBOEH_008806 [Phytophthora boehmeriae]|uniref:Uncharacterized protein n=1 Tax=Phytophthora boehmeriae TaxID=109152 RepID=A0A8T1VXD6_9STRA|nr:hypothetical protein PHYBOEH_008806 [Phytophthora boehmeriae]